MYFKLALSNVRKSFKDYTIYFLTLTFSVCVFYIFNAIESQKAMMIVSETTDMMMRNLSNLIGYLSIFIAIVLGFLILYANKFLIRRRKKELGLYMLLGMEKGKISFVLILETFMIGLCSLIIGLGLGIFASQALSVFTAKLFGTQMKQFQFVFSENGFMKSVICFLLIYLIVMAFNVTSLSKCKLIDLMYANKKNEVPKVKNLKVSVVLFILSVVCLTTAYAFIIHNGLMILDIYFYSAFILAFVGTFLFFMSLSGFLLKVMQGCKRLYYNELNMFIFRQINSKINTTYISMTFICLMLAVTIVTLSSGMAINQSMRDELEKLTPYDASFTWYKDTRNLESSNVKVDEVFEKIGLSIEDYAKESMSYAIYETDIPYEVIYEGQDMSKKSLYLQSLARVKIGAVAVSDYNQALHLQGLAPIELKENEYALNCNNGELIPVIKTYLKNHETIMYEGQAFQSIFKEPLEHTLYVQFSGMMDVVMILPDEVVNREEISTSIVNLNYKSPDMEQKLIADTKAKMDTLKEMTWEEGIPMKWEEGININGITRQLAYDSSVGLSAIMTYLTVYISIIFLITSAAILALQQLTESEDNRSRYQLLRKLGVDEKVINKTLFTQIAIYFIMPLLLAIIHGVVGIYVANRIIVVFGKINVLASIIFTALVFILIYGAYFIGTYLSSKNVIK